MHDQIGRADFLSLYSACGVISSFVSLSRFVLVQNLTASSLGASGAIMGLITAWLTLNWRYTCSENLYTTLLTLPSTKFSIRFLPEDFQPKISAGFVLGAILCLEALTLWKGLTPSVDNCAHLAGFIAGVLGAQVIKVHQNHRQRTGKPQKNGPLGGRAVTGSM